MKRNTYYIRLSRDSELRAEFTERRYNGIDSDPKVEETVAREETIARFINQTFQHVPKSDCSYLPDCDDRIPPVRGLVHPHRAEWLEANEQRILAAVRETIYPGTAQLLALHLAAMATADRLEALARGRMKAARETGGDGEDEMSLQAAEQLRLLHLDMLSGLVL